MKRSLLWIRCGETITTLTHTALIPDQRVSLNRKNILTTRLATTTTTTVVGGGGSGGGVITATITILSPAMIANASSNPVLLVEFIAMLLLLLSSKGVEVVVLLRSCRHNVRVMKQKGLVTWRIINSRHLINSSIYFINYKIMVAYSRK